MKLNDIVTTNTAHTSMSILCTFSCIIKPYILIVPLLEKPWQRIDDVTLILFCTDQYKLLNKQDGNFK
jgi:hypothetical protein